MDRSSPIKRKGSATPRLVLVLRWGTPLAFALFGVLMIVLAHGNLTGVQDSASESNPFTTLTSITHDSVLSTIGVGSLVFSLIILMLSWMLRMNADDAQDRRKEDDAREYFVTHGHWPDEGGAG
jgi:hypothetical protein